MFSYFKSSIDNIVKPVSNFVIGENRFTRESKFSFKDYVTFFCVNKGTFNQAGLEDFIEDDFTNNLEPITRQALSKQRVFINPLVFKEISKEYLRLIGYNRNNHFFLRNTNVFVCMVLMDQILKFPILKKCEESLCIHSKAADSPPLCAAGRILSAAFGQADGDPCFMARS